MPLDVHIQPASDLSTPRPAAEIVTWDPLSIDRGLMFGLIAAAVAGLGAGLVDSAPTHRELAAEPAATSSWPITVARHHGSTKPGHIRADQHLEDQP
jgi:hypothetical protein